MARRGKRQSKGVNLPSAVEKKLLKAYSTPGHRVAFSGPARVSKYFNVTEDQARRALQKLDSYNLHKAYRRPSKFNPYFIFRPIYFQSDLIDVRALAPHNQNVSFLCVIICVFSRKAWVYPMKNKSAKSMCDVLSKWLEDLPLSVPMDGRTLSSDKGSEYVNQHVQKLLRDNNIKFQLSTGTSKSAYAER